MISIDGLMLKRDNLIEMRQIREQAAELDYDSQYDHQ